MNRLSLYLHIPFCVKKCHYCDFLSAPCKEETRQEYVEALCTEIVQRAKLYKEKKVDTIFFEAAAFLRRNGADVTRVRKLFREDAVE